jgi:multicomponent Na+:H+ antiporter subunit C
VTLAAVAGVLPYAVCAWVFLCGVWGVASSRNLVHMVVCLSVMQSSTYVLLLALGWRRHGVAPLATVGAPPAGPMVDPIVQALMLTDVVVSATVVALLLALAVVVHERARTLDPERLRRLRG